MNILIEKLRSIVQERRSAGTRDIAIINSLKEELQYVVLEFIYNNRSYSHLVMYGGTLLRIAYGLPRMSEDLDFQTDKKVDFKKLNEDLITHFKSAYGIDITVKEKIERLTGTDCVYLNFPRILEEIGLKGTGLYTVLKIKLDVNEFTHTSSFATEIVPITKGGYAFAIRTYSLATLMASKVAAVLLRTKRGIGDEIGDCKPRDIFDLMWYMAQKIIPNLEYLRAIHERAKKDMEARTLLDVFDTLRKRVGNLPDNLFVHDLAPFFYNPAEYDAWYGNWRQRFIMLLDSYKIYEIKKNGKEPELLEIHFAEDFSSDNRYFHFYFATENPPNGRVKFTCILTEYWFKFSEFQISTGHRKKEIENHIQSAQGLKELDYEYVGLFYSKIIDYIKRSNFVLLQHEVSTKIIRANADKLNVKKEILLDRRLLLKSKFEDLI